LRAGLSFISAAGEDYMDEPMCEDGDNCLYDIGDAAPDTIEPALHIAQQPQHAICATYGIYHRRNCLYYIGNKQCSNVRGCLHKQQAVR
jgi:hypothetical protein